MHKKRDIVAAILVLGVAIFTFLAARTQNPGQIGHPGPGFFPGAVAIFMFVMGILLLVDAIRNKGGDGDEEEKLPSTKRDYARVVLLVIISAVYLEAMDYAGFIATTPPFCLVVALLLGERRPLVLALHCILVPAAIYVSFQMLLSVPLPEARFLY